MVVRESLHCRFCEAGTPIWRPIVGVCLQTNVGAERPFRLQASSHKRKRLLFRTFMKLWDSSGSVADIGFQASPP